MNFCPLKRYTFNSLGLVCNAETFCAIFKHCGFEKKLYCFGRENSNDTLDRIFFISNQRKTPFSSMFASVVCFSKWQKQKPNANFTAVVPKLLRRLFSLSKTHHVSSFSLQRFQVQNNWPSSLFCSTQKSFFMSILDGCVKRERKALLRV